MPLAVEVVVIEYKGARSWGGLDETAAWPLEMVIPEVFNLDLTCLDLRLSDFELIELGWAGATAISTQKNMEDTAARRIAISMFASSKPAPWMPP